ncbi:heparan-alpha-glucosaminide N-acetyltransferase domain-containing protein, partial [Pantoea sp. SIMBA_072]
LCMLILGACINLPYRLLLVLGLLIVAGHNALDFIQLNPGEWGYTVWTLLHDRGYILQSDALSIRASYPLLPWIGVILLGYA